MRTSSDRPAEHLPASPRPHEAALGAPLLRLQRTAGNAAVAGALRQRSPDPLPTLQRDLGALAAPTSLTGAAAIIPFATFVADVEAVERANPTDSPQEVLSRIRVQWYSGTAFDQLIPGARTADIVPNLSPRGGAGFSVVPRRLGAVAPDARARLTAHADENGVGDNPSPYLGLPNGEQVDAGHLFLTLDALAHPRTSAPYSSFGVPNIDPASWAADVGIASVWLTRAEEGNPDSRAPSNPVPPSADDYWRMSAPEQDLLGDVDGFALHSQWSTQPTQTLSAALRAYYGGAPSAAAGVSRRFRAFCAANGLTYQQSGTSVTWDPAWRAPTIARIDRFNDLYGAGTSGAAFGAIFGPSHRTWPHTPAMLDRFLAWLKPRLEAELRAAAVP